jgi:endoribonuclease Dicer
MAPTVALCEQQQTVIATALPVSVGLISGALQPEQWKDRDLWKNVLVEHRVVVTTPQVLLDALRHGYINLARDIALLVFDEAHHAADKHPYNLIMREFYMGLPERDSDALPPDAGYSYVRPHVLGLTASPIFGGHVLTSFRYGFIHELEWDYSMSNVPIIGLLK